MGHRAPAFGNSKRPTEKRLPTCPTLVARHAVLVQKSILPDPAPVATCVRNIVSFRSHSRRCPWPPRSVLHVLAHQIVQPTLRMATAGSTLAGFAWAPALRLRWLEPVYTHIYTHFVHSFRELYVCIDIS